MTIPAVSKMPGTREQSEYQQQYTRQTSLFLRLNLALQKTLDLEQQLNTVFDELCILFEIDSCLYQNHSENIHVSLGDLQRHTCSYNLTAEDEYLGELLFSRQSRFSKNELEAIENATSALIFPLRNALRHRQAVKCALTDSLTGAGNRISLDNSLKREVDIAHRYQTPLSLALIDLDRFKQVNDQYGHQAGDFVLKEVIQTIASNSRCADMIFRYGGEEFVILLTKTDSWGAHIITERLRAMIAGLACIYENQEIPVTISIGLATLNNADSPKSLLERADSALYQAKHRGRNRVVNLDRA